VEQWLAIYGLGVILQGLTGLTGQHFSAIQKIGRSW
jgi:hypothetical protein